MHASQASGCFLRRAGGGSLMLVAFIKRPFVCLWITGPQNVWFGVWRVLHITTGSKPDVVGGSNSVLSCAVFVKSGSSERRVTGTYQQGTLARGRGFLLYWDLDLLGSALT